MLHCGTITLQTGRLLLRPLEFEDAENMYTNWAGDAAVTKYLRWDAHRNWTVTAEFLNEVAKQYTAMDFYCWGICDRKTGVLFGTISLTRSEREVTRSRWRGAPKEFIRAWEQGLGESWEPGYALGRKWWNQGYATEALEAVCDYWFNTVGAGWLAACHHNDNLASGAVLQKAGFAYDHDVTCHRFDGTPQPCRAYCLLAPPSV